MQKILISENRSKVQDLESRVESVMKSAGELIDTFHAFQGWKRIETEEDLFKLLKDPLGMFDDVIISNVHFASTGNLRPNAQILADLFSIERSDYRNMVSGFPVSEDCQSCRKIKSRSRKRSVSLEEFLQFKNFILFDKGKLSLNEDALSAKKESFRIFAETPDQVSLYNYWHSVCDTFNSLILRGYLSMDGVNAIQKSLGGRITFSYATNKLHLNEDLLTNEIMRLS